MNRFKELRLKNGYKTQQQLAAKLFVNQTAVSQWERGVTIPSSTLLVKLSLLYDVSIDYLLGKDETEKPATVSGDGRIGEFADLFDKLTAEQQALIIAQIKGILSNQ